MSTYNFDINSNSVEQLPPSKRKPNNIAIIRSLFKPIQTIRDAFFTDYVENDLNKRLKYNGEKIVLEYALNTRFGGTFRQPPLVSDIYTTNIAAVEVGFLIGSTAPNSSTIGYTEDYGNSFQLTVLDAVGLGQSLRYGNNFTINIPSALYTPIGATNTERNAIITDFVKKYIPIGLKFTITVI